MEFKARAKMMARACMSWKQKERGSEADGNLSLLTKVASHYHFPEFNLISTKQQQMCMDITGLREVSSQSGPLIILVGHCIHLLYIAVLDMGWN